MDHMDPIEDSEIQAKVESLAGKGTKVVDCEKCTTFKTNEMVLVNGYPVPLQGDEGAQIKKMLLEGQIPSGEFLNEILMRAGILKAPVELETTFNVKSTTKTTELLTLRDKNGILVDERIKEVEEDNEFQQQKSERWKKEQKEEEERLRRAGRRVETLYNNGQDTNNNIKDEINKLPGKESRDRPSPGDSYQHRNGQWNGRQDSSSPQGSPETPPPSYSSLTTRMTSSRSSPERQGQEDEGEDLEEESWRRHCITSSTVVEASPPEIFRSITDALSSTPRTQSPSDSIPNTQQCPNGNNVNAHFKGTSFNPTITNGSHSNGVNGNSTKFNKRFQPSLSLVPSQWNGKPVRFTYETFV